MSMANLVLFVWVFCLGPGPVPCFASLLFLFGRNANLAGGFACRRFWWFVVLFLFDDLPFSYETKAFHAEFSNLFTRLFPMLGPSLRAISATTEEKKVSRETPAS